MSAGYASWEHRGVKLVKLEWMLGQRNKERNITTARALTEGYYVCVFCWFLGFCFNRLSGGTDYTRQECVVSALL